MFSHEQMMKFDKSSKAGVKTFPVPSLGMPSAGHQVSNTPISKRLSSGRINEVKMERQSNMVLTVKVKEEKPAVKSRFVPLKIVKKCS